MDCSPELVISFYLFIYFTAVVRGTQEYIYDARIMVGGIKPGSTRQKPTIIRWLHQIFPITAGD